MTRSWAEALRREPAPPRVLGYLLADTSDQQRIRGVGWYFSRHGLLWQLPIEEFLSRLHGGDVDLAAARAEFAELVQPSPRAPAVTEQTPYVRTIASVERTAKFYPNGSGRGRWHISARDVVGSYIGNPTRPGCGTRSTLDLAVTPVCPILGQTWDEDERLCVSCLHFTRTGSATLLGAEGAPAAPAE